MKLSLKIMTYTNQLNTILTNVLIFLIFACTEPKEPYPCPRYGSSQTRARKINPRNRTTQSCYHMWRVVVKSNLVDVLHYPMVVLPTSTVEQTYSISYPHSIRCWRTSSERFSGRSRHLKTRAQLMLDLVMLDWMFWWTHRHNTGNKKTPRIAINSPLSLLHTK